MIFRFSDDAEDAGKASTPDTTSDVIEMTLFGLRAPGGDGPQRPLNRTESGQIRVRVERV
jgi:hypothetical protein